MKPSTIAIYPGQNKSKGSRTPLGPNSGRARSNRIAIGQLIVFRGPFAGKKILVSVFSDSHSEDKLPYYLRYDGVLSTSVTVTTGDAERAEITLARGMRHHKSGGTFILSIQVGDDNPLQLEYHLTYKNYEARLTESQKRVIQSHLVYDPTEGTFECVHADIVDKKDSTTLLDRSFAHPGGSKTFFGRIFAQRPPTFEGQQTKKRPPQDDGSKGWFDRVTQNPTGLSLPPLKRQALQSISQARVVPHRSNTLAPLKITNDVK